MIIYFADRNLTLTGQASTTLPGGFRFFDDSTVEEIESGITTFSCKVSYNDSTRADLEAAVKSGFFVLKGKGTAFTSEENTYDSLFEIKEIEFDTKSQEMSIYAEDAGLELINRVCPEATLNNKTLREMLQTFVPSDWSINLIGTPTGRKTNTWDGENTATERINSVASLFDCEVFYSFVIERFRVQSKVLNIIPKRGNQDAVAQLRLDRDIDRILTKTSIAELATAYKVTGGTPEGSENPINLKGYSYSYTDPETGDVYKVDTATGEMRNESAMKRWKSVLDSDGLIVKSFEYDTTNKAELAGQARAELQKYSKESVEYEVDFVRLPPGTEVGDRINIIDEAGEVYIEARLLKIETSVANMTQTATVGDHIIKESGISAQIAAMAKEFAVQSKDGLNSTTISVMSSGGNIFHNTPISTTLTATVFYGQKVIEGDEKLQEIFGPTAKLVWYSGSNIVNTGFSFLVSSPNDSERYTVRLEI